MRTLAALCSLFLCGALAIAQERTAYEAVIHDRGKTIGSTILLEIAADGKVSGWIQKHDYFPIDSGTADTSTITFTAAGNTYKINRQASRIQYGGPDGSGDQRVTRMEPVKGRVYKLKEALEDDPQVMTLQMPEEREFMIDHPTIWKHNGPPIRGFERYLELLGKTTTFWQVRYGGGLSIEIVEEPEGMDILAKLPKEKDKKKKR
jgi:hypothetical protein